LRIYFLHWFSVLLEELQETYRNNGKLEHEQE